MPKIKHGQSKVQQRTARIRGKLFGTEIRPRLTVHRSQQHLSLQVINDDTQHTLAAVTDVGKTAVKGTKTERSTLLAAELLKKLQKAKITKLVFDRGSHRFHGRIKAVATALREGGIEV